MSSNNLTAHRQFEVDFRQANADALIEENKKAHEADAQQELYAKMGNTLADFLTWPDWTVEDADEPGIRIYTLAMKVIFKP